MAFFKSTRQPQLVSADPDDPTMDPDDLVQRAAMTDISPSSISASKFQSYIYNSDFLEHLRSLQIQVPQSLNNSSNNTEPSNQTNVASTSTTTTSPNNNTNQIIQLPITSFEGVDHTFAQGSDYDPLSAIGVKSSRLRQMVQNHVYMIETLVLLQRWQSCRVDRRPWLLYSYARQCLSEAGLVLDLPASATSGPVENTAFIVNQERGNRLSVSLTFRFSEELIVDDTAHHQDDPTISETIDLSKLGDGEMSALIEDRVCCRVVLNVHPEDTQKLLKANRDSELIPSAAYVVHKNAWDKRDVACANVRVQFSFYAFIVR